MNFQGFQTVSRRGRSMITSSTISSSSSSRRAWRTEAVRRYSKNIITSCNANAASLIRQSQHSNSKSMSSIVSPMSVQSIRWKSSSSSSESTVTSTKAKDGMDKVVKVPKPTNVQLRNHFIAHAIPMIGFGLMDQTVMIQAGHHIDCSLGVTFGLSTLTAAAVGGLISNVCGVLFGGTVESITRQLGLNPMSNMSMEQRSLSWVRRGRIISQAIGVFLGCALGLFNLLGLDMSRSQSLKLQSLVNENEFAFEVEIIQQRASTTTTTTTTSGDSGEQDSIPGTRFIIRGPDVDGTLASLTAAFTLNSCSVRNVTARRLDNGFVEDVFVVVDRMTQLPLEDDRLEEMAQVVLQASKMGPQFLNPTTRWKELEETNDLLQQRIQTLEGVLLKRRLTVVTRK